MQKQFSVVLFGALVLAGCGGSSSPTPLSHALTALRAGDQSQLEAAQAEADEAVKTAIQPGQDLCAVSGADIAKYSAQYVIRKISQPDIVRLPEEQRLLYALKLADHSKVQPESFLNNAPIVTAATHSGPAGNCDKDKQMAAMMAGGGYMQDDDEARIVALTDWIASMKAKYGDKLDDTMRSAKSQLENAGYSSKWPVDPAQD